MFLIFFVIGILLTVIITVMVKNAEYKQQEKKEQEELKKINCEYENRKNTIDNRKKDRIAKYGSFSYEKCITLDIITLFFEVYEEKSILIIGRMYNDEPFKEIINVLSFKDIIDAKIMEQGRVINSTSTLCGDIKSNTGSMIGRAVVGGVVAGGVGAIIGGTTGNKSTNTYCNTKTHEIVNYKLTITMNDLKNPIVSIDFDNQRINFMQNLYSVLQVIINRNKEQAVLSK
ncbi:MULTISPECIES: hypothetical protein [Butyricimonas]|uniref:hypothetical protein n=1 Tax=Butyricimonas TaxID=574697 RepID=UPI0007FB2348|nr:MULTISPECIES: hypothetical protein [Butyricimonas]